MRGGWGKEREEEEFVMCCCFGFAGLLDGEMPTKRGRGKETEVEEGELFPPSYTTPQKRKHDRSRVVLFDLC